MIKYNQASFDLRWKENLVKHQKFAKYYDHGCGLDFDRGLELIFVCFISFLQNGIIQYQKSLLFYKYIKSKSLNSMHLWWTHFLQWSQPILLSVSNTSFSQKLHEQFVIYKIPKVKRIGRQKKNFYMTITIALPTTKMLSINIK